MRKFTAYLLLVFLVFGFAYALGTWNFYQGTWYNQTTGQTLNLATGTYPPGYATWTPTPSTTPWCYWCSPTVITTPSLQSGSPTPTPYIFNAQIDAASGHIYEGYFNYYYDYNADDPYLYVYPLVSPSDSSYVPGQVKHLWYEGGNHDVNLYSFDRVVIWSANESTEIVGNDNSFQSPWYFGSEDFIVPSSSNAQSQTSIYGWPAPSAGLGPTVYASEVYYNNLQPTPTVVPILNQGQVIFSNALTPVVLPDTNVSNTSTISIVQSTGSPVTNTWVVTRAPGSGMTLVGTNSNPVTMLWTIFN